MLSLSFLFWSTFVIGLVSFWWQSDKVKINAMRHLHLYCKEQQLQLLDQTMVLKGVWPQRNAAGSLQLRRRYVFEFTTTGAERYKGLIELIGPRLQRIELEPHILPEESNRLQ